MKERLTVFRAVFTRELIMMQRYLVNSISGVVTLYIVFMLLFVGARAVTGGGLVMGATTMEGLVVGYLVWMFAMMGYQELAWGIINEAQVGTLEKLYLTPVGFRWVNGFAQLSQLAVNLTLLGLVFALIMLTTGLALQVDIISIVPLLLITATSAYGLGFALAGLALIHKRIQAAFQIVQFILVAFIAAPSEAWGRLLPLNLGHRLLTSAMVDGTRIWELPPGSLLTAVLVGAGYLGLGLLVMERCERRARDRGLLGHY